MRCGCSLPVRDLLSALGEKYGVGEQPFAWKCGACHGPCNDEEVEQRARWYYDLLSAIRRSKKGALFEKEETLWKALRARYS